MYVHKSRVDLYRITAVYFLFFRPRVVVCIKRSRRGGPWVVVYLLSHSIPIFGYIPKMNERAVCYLGIDEGLRVSMLRIIYAQEMKKRKVHMFFFCDKLQTGSPGQIGTVFTANKPQP